MRREAVLQILVRPSYRRDPASPPLPAPQARSLRPRDRHRRVLRPTLQNRQRPLLLLLLLLLPSLPRPTLVHVTETHVDVILDVVLFLGLLLGLLGGPQHRLNTQGVPKFYPVTSLGWQKKLKFSYPGGVFPVRFNCAAFLS